MNLLKFLPLFLLLIGVEKHHHLVAGKSGKTTRIGSCNVTALNELCSRSLCLANPGNKCDYREYKNEYCQCCKQCKYPPPNEVRTTCRHERRSTAVLCTLEIYDSCTSEQYIEEICRGCRHCPYI